METRTLKLSDTFINILVNLPENGMGYQVVKVILKSGKVLHQHKVINSSLLMLEENENITEKDSKNRIRKQEIIYASITPRLCYCLGSCLTNRKYNNVF